MEWVVAAAIVAGGLVAAAVIWLGQKEGLAPYNPFGPFGFQSYVVKIGRRGGKTGASADRTEAGAAAQNKGPATGGEGEKKT